MRAAGARWVAGVDEAGRGCWAGPVTAAAVILPEALLADPTPLAGVDDSKTLAPAQRARLYTRILAAGVAWSVVSVPAGVIDSHGILAATVIAMQAAVLGLTPQPDALLIDAVHLPGWHQRALIRGDARCLSIAAASIIAKVTRDRIMAAHDRHDPRYGFGRHKGYGTALHQAALWQHGVHAQHRRSYAPVRAWLESQEQ